MTRARHVAVAVAVEAGFGADCIAATLGLTRRSVRRLASAPSPEAALRVARRALALAVAVTRRRLAA